MIHRIGNLLRHRAHLLQRLRKMRRPPLRRYRWCLLLSAWCKISITWIWTWMPACTWCKEICYKDFHRNSRCRTWILCNKYRLLCSRILTDLAGKIREIVTTSKTGGDVIANLLGRYIYCRNVPFDCIYSYITVVLYNLASYNIPENTLIGSHLLKP